jgi:hypothetical protein
LMNGKFNETHSIYLWPFMNIDFQSIYINIVYSWKLTIT